MCYSGAYGDTVLVVSMIILARVFLAEFSGNQRALLKMVSAAEIAKHALSSKQSASVCIESLHNGMDFQCTVSRWVFVLDRVVL